MHRQLSGKTVFAGGGWVSVSYTHLIHASLFYGEKGVDWEWDETGEMPVKLNVMPSGKKGTWTFGQYGQDLSLIHIY